MSETKELQKRIRELEDELARKDQDLKIYRNELAQANSHLENLIVQTNDQLQQAVKIQKYLVPTEFPNIQGFDFSTKFKSSSHSGGDYFDIFEHHDKMRFGIFLSSSSGYGMSALFLSVIMKLAFEIEDTQSRDPAQVMREIFKEVSEQGKPEDETAIFYGVFDRRKFNLTYSNVGQPLTIYHQASANKLELMQDHLAPYSPGAQVSLKNQSIELQPRDKLVFCSQGFLALENSHGDKWELEEVLSLIKKNIHKGVHELRNEIFYQASKYSEDPPRDLTVIVMEVKDRIIKLASDQS